MTYNQSAPSEDLLPFIKSFWMVDGGEDRTQRIEKIVPDGFPEIIFHYGEPYKINISGQWELQAKDLVAGQISRFFNLRNTGRIGMFAIKFQPWALHRLFGLKMETLTDQVIPLPKDLKHQLADIETIAISSAAFETKMLGVEEYFRKQISSADLQEVSTAQRAAEEILKHHGNINLKEMRETLNVSERTLQRTFKSQIGASTKFYSRIIRLSNVFKMVSEEKVDWAKVIFDAGFYDQPHFIRNFKEFTGEEPSKYGFHKENMANLFLRDK